tara:strand:+ start:346 stop:708 length:363 start_codon:yes stop_codon:yes gene_type:complete
MVYTNLFHILVLGTLLSYIGFFKIKDARAYMVLAILSLLILVLVPLPVGVSLSYWNLVHISHYLVMLPALLYLSYLGYNNKIPEQHFNTIGAVGAIIVVYHSFKLYTRLPISKQESKYKK